MRTRDMAVALCLLAGPSVAADEIRFSESEIRAILAHGPWPAPLASDPSKRNWTDNRVRGVAAAEVDRNTPTLMNARLGRWYGWDGGADSLWSQSIRPGAA